jgi:hypothetical protein
MVAATAATLAVQVGVYALAMARGVPPRKATIGVLAAATVWVCLTAPILAAAGRGAVSMLLRGGIVVDASAVALLAVWILNRVAPPPPSRLALSFLGLLEIYVVLAAVALAGIGAVACARSDAGRYTVATLAAVFLLAAAATPFWVGGLLAAAEPEARRHGVRWAVHANPFYSVAAAVNPETEFIWHQKGLMYDRITRLGSDQPAPPVSWYAAAWRYALVAGVLTAVAWARAAWIARRRHRPR